MMLHAQSVVYVAAGSTGDGSSWTKAFGNLDAALGVAESGDQVWVAAGKYVPTTNNDRNIAFKIPSGVKVFGGFTGKESSLDERNYSRNHTILSGEIGNPSSTEDNSYTIVYFERVNRNTVIDGFMIQNGYSDGTGNKGDIRRAGAGIFNDGSGGVSVPVIQNCIFSGNFGRDGGAIYNYSYGGEASPSIISCEFMYNKADLEGGAICNDGTKGICNSIIRDCNFVGNEASYGACILNLATENGEVAPMIEGCSFSGNVAYTKGSSVFNYKGSGGKCTPFITGCNFEDNTQSLGSDVEDVPTYSVEKSNSKPDIKIGSGK